MSIWTTDIRQGEKQCALQKSKKPIESYSAHNCSSWERFECLLQPSSKEVSWIIIHIDQMRDHTVKLWWARRTRSSSSSIFFFTSFACHKCLIRPVIRLNCSFSFLGTRVLHAIQTLSNWLGKEILRQVNERRLYEKKRTGLWLAMCHQIELHDHGCIVASTFVGRR